MTAGPETASPGAAGPAQDSNVLPLAGPRAASGDGPGQVATPPVAAGPKPAQPTPPAAQPQDTGLDAPEAADEDPEAAKAKAASLAAKAKMLRARDLLRSVMRMTQFYGRPVGETDILDAAASAPEELSIDALHLAGNRLGYKVAVAPMSRESLDAFPVPFVLLQDPDPATVEAEGVDEKHATARVVLERDGPQFSVYDPRAGANLTLSHADLLADVEVRGGAILLMKPFSSADRENQNWRNLITARVRGVIWELGIASLVINIFALAGPLFVMTVYNKVIGNQAVDTLTVLAVGMISLYVFDSLLRIVRSYISSHTGARLEALIGGEVFHHLLHLPYRHFENTASGMIGERLRQLDTIRAFFTGQMPLTIVDLAFVGVFLLVLFMINSMLGFVTLAVMPVFVLLSIAFHATQRKLAEQSFMGQAARSSALNETITNALTVKSLALESEVERRFHERLGLAAWTGFRVSNLSGAIATIGQLLQQVAGLAIIFIGARAIISGEMNVGELIAANILASRAIAPMRQVVSAWYQLQEVRAAFTRINQIMDEPVELKPGEVGPGLTLRGHIRLENLSFAYGEEGPEVLQDVSLDIEAGQVVGIIGPSGSGKSTIAKLVQGLYAPTNGRVLIDGTDVQHMSPSSLRRQIGVVPQDIQLFAGTVRENIAFGVGDKDPARVVQVARFVGAHDFIQHLPKGYDTVLTERGFGLSAGQRQLLSIARALMRNPRIMILDEATSALDAVTEERLMRNLRRAARGRTIILISHRMAPVVVTDRAALVIDGRIERVGAPQEVIAFARTRMAERAAEAAGERPSGGEGPSDWDTDSRPRRLDPSPGPGQGGHERDGTRD
ncbi:MAG: ATP-binding cassette domain-containing protein [Sneathiellaceae bacterium]